MAPPTGGKNSSNSLKNTACQVRGQDTPGLTQKYAFTKIKDSQGL